MRIALGLAATLWTSACVIMRLIEFVLMEQRGKRQSQLISKSWKNTKVKLSPSGVYAHKSSIFSCINQVVLALLAQI